MITTSKQITKHFHSTEFKCKCGCGRIKIDEKLVNNMEKIFSKLNVSKCIISSGYRCPNYDKKIGGFVGKHAEGIAADCIYYHKNGKPIPSKYVICAAYDLDLFRGIAKINSNYTHLDIRKNGYYKGDETVSNNSVWSNPYDYFKVTKEDMARYTGEIIKKSVDEMAQEVIDGKWGVQPQRQELLENAGYDYKKIQKRVNEILSKKTIDEVARDVINGDYGNQPERQKKLEAEGYNYREVQNRVNQLLK